MNTRTQHWNFGRRTPASTTWLAEWLNHVTQFTLRWIAAGVVYLATVIAAASALEVASAIPLLQASTWAAGFIFLALAIETREGHFIAFLATGLALPILALLSAYVATEFIIVAATVIAAWIAAVILRK